MSSTVSSTATATGSVSSTGVGSGLDIGGIVTDFEIVGADTVDGRQTTHYRIVADMSVAVMGNHDLAVCGALGLVPTPPASNCRRDGE